MHVVRHDGTFFKASPSKIGVEGHLYTRYELTGQKDLTIERWFSENIETPFVAALERLIERGDVRISPLPARRPDKEQELRELGFIVPKVVETLSLSSNHRGSIDAYVAALLVRNPRYLAKIIKFHDHHDTSLPPELPRAIGIKNVALENMLQVFEIYRERISAAYLGLLIAEGDHEFIFPDAGITADEPWRSGPVPFDIHAPLTPKLALEVLPVADGQAPTCHIMRVNNRGIARMNRLALEDAENFVFTKGKPPISFITKYFGKPAPKSVGMRFSEEGLETKFDRSRDQT